MPACRDISDAQLITTCRLKDSYNGLAETNVLRLHRCMAVAKRGPGHCLVLCWGLLLLSVCAHAARDSLQGAGSDTKSSKRPPHARPPPPPSSDQGARPVLTAAKSKLQKLPTVAAMVVGASADAAAKAQQTDSERREQLVGAGTDAEQQQQQATDPGLLEMGAVGVATEPFQQPQALQNKPFPAGGAKGAQREPHQQPKALHDEQFPGNGAQVRLCCQCRAACLQKRPFCMAHLRRVCLQPQLRSRTAHLPSKLSRGDSARPRDFFGTAGRGIIRSRRSSCRRPGCRRSSPRDSRTPGSCPRSSDR